MAGRNEFPRQTLRALGLFTLALVMTSLAAGVLLIALGWVMPWLGEATSAVTWLGTLALASHLTARRLRRRDAMPSGVRAWILAGQCALVVMVFQALTLWLLLSGPAAETELVPNLSLVVTFAVVAVLQFLALRLGLGAGGSAALEPVPAQG